MMRRTVPLLAALVVAVMTPALSFPTMAAAQATSGKAAKKTADSGEKKKEKKKVDITADKMEIFDDKNMAVFTGNVKAIRGDTTLYTKRLEVGFRKVKRDDGTEKTEATFLRAFDGVRIVQPNRVITGKKMRMDVKKDLVWVSGNVVVKEEDSVIRGEKLFSNLKTDVSRMESTGKKRVRGLFSTE